MVLIVTGGAIEITLVGDSNNTDNHSLFKRLIGYVYLFGNTICMVRSPNTHNTHYTCHTLYIPNMHASYLIYI